MSLKVIESEEALRDAIAIADYTAEHSGLNASDRFLEAVKQGYRQLATMPGRGVRRDYGNPAFAGMRMWLLPRYRRKYLIFYLTTETELRIVRLLHSARNITEADPSSTHPRAAGTRTSQQRSNSSL